MSKRVRSKQWTRALALVITLAMLLSMICVGSFAQAPTSSLDDAILYTINESGELEYNVTYTADIAESTIVSDKSGNGIDSVAELKAVMGEADLPDVVHSVSPGERTIGKAVTADLTIVDGAVQEIEVTAVSQRPIIGISWKSEKIGDDYQGLAEAYERNGAIAVYLPQVTSAEQARKVLSQIDGIFFTGGEDWNPRLYDEEQTPHGSAGWNDARDTSDINLMQQAVAMDVPLFAVCRGEQGFNIAMGGGLIQDVPYYLGQQVLAGKINPERVTGILSGPSEADMEKIQAACDVYHLDAVPDIFNTPVTDTGHYEGCEEGHLRVQVDGLIHSGGDKYHELAAGTDNEGVAISKDSKWLYDIVGADSIEMIATAHHQSANPENLGDGLTVVARSADGIIEALEYQDATFALALQWHPERDALGGTAGETLGVDVDLCNAFLRALVEHAAGDTGFGFSSDDTLTYADMLRLQDKLQSENLKIPGLEGGADYDRTVSQQEVAAALLQYAGMTEAQLGEYPRDYNFMADSVGLIDGLDFNSEAACTGGMFMTMLDNVGVLYDALHAEKKEPLFVDGVAQPIFDFDSASRYCVYVESNYDTDGDGELDLIKALVQLPSEVVEDGTQIATIFEARPYVTGTLNKVDESYGTEGYDIDSLYAQPEPRVPGEVISTAEAIAKTDKSDYYYETPYDSDPTAYEDLNWYDYYLVRGFAVVSCGGPGTKGSGGFETCGTDLEIDAFKCVIEWLTGDRVAYASPDGDQTVVADWSNGNVGMTGKSYGGTTQFGLATTGVKGLKTIVPVAGIASWYEYTNSQGIYTRGTANYVDTLAWYCNGRYYDPEDYATIKENFENYLNQLKNDQLALNGDYGEPWEVRDYTLDWENIQCPALIVHGLNDLNVRTKQFDLMYQAYQKAGVDVKLLLHQSNHIVPTYPGHKTEMYIDDILYDELLNKWFSHYLYGVENGIEDMAEVTVQSNVDGSWDYYDSWETDNSTTLDCSDYAEAEETTISSNLEENGITTGRNGNWESEFAKGPTGSSAFYATEVTEDMTIQGAVEVHIKASTDAQGDPIAMSAMLVDIGPEDFKAYTQSSLSHDTVLVEGGAWMGGGLDNFDLVELTQEEVPYKVIANGWLDMCNPKAGYDSVSASADQKIQVENGKFYDYVMYLQPTLYTVQERHTLALVIFTYDPSQISVSAEDAYTITIDNSETYAMIPLEEEEVTGGSSSGGSSTTITTTTDGNGTVIKVVTDKTTGTITTTMEYKNGVTVKAVENSVGVVTVNVTVPSSVDSATVTIPVKNPTTSTVAKLSKSGQVIRTGVAGKDGITLTLTESTSLTILDNAKIFSDVASGQWYAEAVNFVTSHEIFAGVGNGTFAPNSTMTRAMLWTVLYGLEGQQSAAAGQTWYSNAQDWAMKNGVSDGTNPNGSITREQIAVTLYGYAKAQGIAGTVTGDLSKFQDASSVSSWATEAMAWAVQNGLISGKDNGSLAPQDTATRAELAQIMMQFVTASVK